MTPTEDYIGRSKRFNFWKFVSKKRSGCWEWSGCLDGGYGSIWNGSKMERAHRFSYLTNVGNIPNGMNVCHKCDNRKCVRPSHLFLGTPSENALDMWRKGRARQNPRKGTDNPDAKLTERQVASIRKAYKRGKTTYEKLGKKYGVSLGLIFLVVKRRAWAHVA